jgi:hypothetical protein
MNSSTDLAYRSQAAHERFATGQLVQGDVFVGLVRLLDAAGAADHSGNARALEQPSLGSERDLGGLLLARQALCQPGDSVLRRAEKAGNLAQGFELEPRLRRRLRNS